MESVDAEFEKMSADLGGVDDTTDKDLEVSMPLSAALEKVVTDTEETKLEASQPKEKTYSDEEQQAMSKGWKPDGVKSAGEFLRAGELIDQLKEVRSENKHNREALEYLINTHKQQQMAAYEQGLRDAEAKRLEAVNNSDIQAFQYYDNNVKQLQQTIGEAKRTEVISTQNQDVKSIVDDFVSRNRSWYDASNEDNEPLVAYANLLDGKLLESIPDHKQRLATVEMKVKQKFASHSAFQNPNREQANAVINSNERKGSNTESAPKLTKQQSVVFRYIKKIDPSYTESQYLAEWN